MYDCHISQYNRGEIMDKQVTINITRSALELIIKDALLAQDKAGWMGLAELEGRASTRN